MKFSIRKGVFETNSSSTHSLTMCSKNDYDLWKEGKVYLNEDGGFFSDSIYKNKDFVTLEEAVDIMTNNDYPPKTNLALMSMDELNEYLKEHEIYTYDNYFKDYMEGFKHTYKTSSGETIIAFGQYGYNG